MGNGGVGDQWVMDTYTFVSMSVASFRLNCELTWIWNQVSLELVEVDVQGTIETNRCGDGRDDLSNQTVKVLVRRTWDIEISSANIVDGLIVDKEGTVGVLNGAVGSKDSVIRLNNGGRDTRSWVNGELQLALLAVVKGETLQEKSTETGTSSSTEGVEEQETLKTRALIGYLADLVDDAVDELLSDSVVTTSICVSVSNSVLYPVLRIQSVQLFAASSFPLTKSSGWKSDRY
jgi:hypothetical protein